MQKKHVVIMIILVSLMIQSMLSAGPLLSPNNSSQPAQPTINKTPVQSAGAGGEDPLVTNVLDGGGFEQAESNGAPSMWDSHGSCYLVQNASYTALQHGGTYSGRILALATQQWGGSSYLEYDLLRWYPTIPKASLTQGISLDLYTYVVSSEDLARGSYCSVRVYINCLGTTRFLNYFISYRSVFLPANSTNEAYFGLNSTIGSWHNLHRNVTSDYQSRFGVPQSTYFVHSISCYVLSPNAGSGLTECVIDDVNLENRTAYEFLLNGDFEDGDGSYWQGSGLQSPGYAYTTADCRQGSRAANLTVKMLGPNSEGYVYSSRYFDYPQGLYAVQPGSAVFEFDWKYNDTYNGGFFQYAYLHIQYENTSYYGVTELYLGQGNDWFSHANTTYNIFLKAAGFGSRGTWQHESLDVGALFQQRNIRNVDIEGFYFYVYAGGSANASVTLLLDRFELLTYPTFDPGFEQDWYWSSYVPVTGWSRTDEIYPYVNRTSFAHSGKWAANLTAYGDVAAGLARQQFVGVNESIFTDFWYQVKDITSVGDNLAFIRLYFDAGVALYYVLAGSNHPLTNDSSNVYYYVSDFNQTGEWKNLVRNIKADLEAAFAPANWNLTQVQIRCFAYSGGKVSVIFDDMSFVRDTKGPELIQALLVGLPPTYYRQADVRIDLTDVSPYNATLYYNNGSGWVRTQPFYTGSYFLGHIPKCPYGTVVHWYVNATDSFGHIAIYDNHGSYYSYVSGDDVPPVIDSVTPNNTIVNGWSTVNVSAHDPDVGSSGVSNVELWSGTNLLASTNSAPYQLHWNTQVLSNGSHTLTLKVLDSAGNIASVTLQYDIENVPTTTTSTTTTSTSSTVTTPTSINPLLIGAAGAAAIVIVLAIVCMKRRAK